MRGCSRGRSKTRLWRAAVKPGDCFVMDSGDGFLVFGEVLEDGEPGRLRHYRFCRCYSEACPEGELGDVHVLGLHKIGF